MSDGNPLHEKSGGTRISTMCGARTNTDSRGSVMETKATADFVNLGDRNKSYFHNKVQQ
ncbi:hypothetical protein Scep_028403 [Stephania cephalantha]|uniref:Uncharacterized protein n=1 Tax=Stephania cephalantha TaxID=152367 RepID=A0AAP0E9X1_9MAGN